MTMRLAREAYKQMIAEDVAWLMACQPSLERDHILAILQCSESREYDRPPAPVAEIREAVEVTDEMCNRTYLRKWEAQTSLSGAEPDDEDRQWAREWLAAWRSELGPTLGLVELREPTEAECDAIYFAACKDLNGQTGHEGREMFRAVRAVMFPQKSEVGL